MDTDVRLLRVKGSTASPARGYLTASQFVSALLHPQEEDAFWICKMKSLAQKYKIATQIWYYVSKLEQCVSVLRVNKIVK